MMFLYRQEKEEGQDKPGIKSQSFTRKTYIYHTFNHARIRFLPHTRQTDFLMLSYVQSNSSQMRQLTLSHSVE